VINQTGALILQRQLGVSSAMALVVSNMIGTGVFTTTGFLVGRIVSTVNAMITIGPRVYHAMAKDGAFLNVAARASERSRVPVGAILCQGACAILMTFLLSTAGHLHRLQPDVLHSACVSSLFVFRPTQGLRRQRSDEMHVPERAAGAGLGLLEGEHV
jgi:amino acid transporter